MAARYRVLIRMALAAPVCAVMLQPAAAESRGSRSPEGAWYGMVVVTNIPNIPPIPATDIYSSSSTSPTREGTVLCTVPEGKMPVVVDGEIAYWVRWQPTGSGTWVRVGRNKIAVTVWRLLVNADTGAPVGWGKNWGIGTMPSDDRLVVNLKAQFYDLNGLPIATRIESTVTEDRVRVDLEEQAGPR